MSFNVVASKTASISTNVLTLASTLFNFASSDLTGAQKVTLLASTASLYINWSTVNPSTTLGSGVPVTTGVAYSLTGALNVAQLKMIAQTTAAAGSVLAILEK